MECMDESRHHNTKVKESQSHIAGSSTEHRLTGHDGGGGQKSHSYYNARAMHRTSGSRLGSMTVSALN